MLYKKTMANYKMLKEIGVKDHPIFSDGFYPFSVNPEDKE